MATHTVFLATHSPSIPNACRIFALTGKAKATASEVRSHLLRSWELFVRVFNDADTAELWATATVVRGAATASPAISQCTATTMIPLPAPLTLASFPPIDGTLLVVYTDGDESVIDLADPASAAAFFMSLGRPACGKEVVVRGLSLPPRPVSPSRSVGPPPASKRRRLATSAAAPSQLPATDHHQALQRVPALMPSLRRPVHQPAADHRDASGGGRGEPRKRVAWAYGGGGYGCAGGTGKTGRAARLPVAIMPQAVHLQSRVDGDVLRLCRLLLRRQDVFLTGPPGCGKTHLVCQVVTALRDAGVAVTACGSSGVAAGLVGGTTVHSWAGFCNGDADVWSPIETVVNDVIPYAAKVRMCSAMVLVIDEVGTLSAAFITRLDLVLRAVRRRSEPFGGLTLLAAGDFLQLAPPFGSYAFLADVWGLVFGHQAVILVTNWRQMRDPQLLGLLLRLRTGQHTDADMALLATRRTEVPPPSVVCLFCHALDAINRNEEELRLLPGPSVVFEAVDKVQDGPYLTLASASSLLDGALKLSRVVSLRVGAVVAVPTACLASQGVPCGTRGIVICFRAVGRRRYPRVRFSLQGGTSKVIDVTPTVGHVVALDGVKRASTRMQVPLVLAWASTIHSAQGWTLEEAAVDLTNAFAAGQALSGLSRTSTLGGLYLIGFDEDRIIVDDAALAFHESLVAMQ